MADVMCVDCGKTCLTDKQCGINAWQWKTKDDDYLHPNDMETRHLFYVLRMIWNHFMPEELKLHPYNHYRFGEFYNDAYLKTAIIACGTELGARDDLTLKMKTELSYMESIFTTKPELLTQQPRRIAQ